MKPATSPHPSLEELYAFAHGTLVGHAFQVVADHVESCDACCSLLAEQPDNTLLELAREVATWGQGEESSATSSSDGNDLPGELLQHPRYAVFEMIGKGGMGAVYRAEHRMMQRTVALKVIHSRLLTNPKVIERFEREVRLAAKLSHPNIVVSYDADRAGDLHFLVMEYVEGKTLDRWISEHGPVDYQRACDWIRQAALGLQHAHEMGMAHRDIKPHNLILTSEGQLRILDFGLSRLVTDSTEATGESEPNQNKDSRTLADVVLGTPEYIAPEQIQQSREAGIRADIYGLGCTLFFLLTGRSPFHRASIKETLEAQLHDPLPDLRSINSNLPDRFVALLDRMTAKRPEDRPIEPQEVVLELEKIARGDPSTEFKPMHHPMLRRRTILAAGLLVAGLLGSAAFYHEVIGNRPTRLLVMLPSRGLWFPDFRELQQAAASTGTQLTFASWEDHPSEVLSSSEPGIAVPDIRLNGDVRAADYDGVVFIGYNTQEFHPDGIAGAEVGRLLNEFQMQKKIVAALCAGQRVLAQHGALRGKTVTPALSVQAYEVEVEGAKRIERDVWVDGLVVTCAEAAFAKPFLEEIEKVAHR